MSVSNGDIVRGVVEFLAPQNALSQNVFTFEYTGSGDTDAEVGAEFESWAAAAWEIIDQDLNVGFGSEVSRLWKWNAVDNEWIGIWDDTFQTIQGEDNGHMLPHGAACLMKFYTSIPKRQGRKYLQGYTENTQTSGVWDSLPLARMATFVSALLGDITTTNGTLEGGVFNEVTESFLPFRSEGGISLYQGYQRRRRPGVGI